MMNLPFSVKSGQNYTTGNSVVHPIVALWSEGGTTQLRLDGGGARGLPTYSWHSMMEHSYVCIIPIIGVPRYDSGNFGRTQVPYYV
jgi:hypothetical protein